MPQQDHNPEYTGRRAWLLSGYDQGRQWTRDYSSEHYDVPDLTAFLEYQTSRIESEGLEESRFKRVFQQGLDAGYCDESDRYHGEWLALRDAAITMAVEEDQ